MKVSYKILSTAAIIFVLQLSFFLPSAYSDVPCTDPDCPCLCGRTDGGSEEKTMVILKSFTAAPTDSLVALNWVTASETGTEGFYLYRSLNGVDGYEKVNGVIIPARGTGYTGASYSYTDTSVSGGLTYYYKLVEIESTGKAINYGPVIAMVGSSSTSLVASLDDPDKKEVDPEDSIVPWEGTPETREDTVLKVDDTEEAKFARVLGVMVPRYIKNIEDRRQEVEGGRKEEKEFLGNNAFSEELENVAVGDRKTEAGKQKAENKKISENLKSVSITSAGIIKWITIENGKPVLHVSNSEKDLKRFGDRLAEYLFIDPTELKKEVHVSKREIANFYRKNKIDYGLSTRIKLSQIFVKIDGEANHKSRTAASAKIKKILAKIKKGEKFAKVAKTASEGPSAKIGGDIGWITRGMILPDLENAAFSLKKGNVSRALRSPGGYHILKVENTWQGRYIPFKKVKAEVKEKLVTQKAWELALKKSQDIWRKHWEGYKQSKLMQGKDGYYVVQMDKAMGMKLAKR